MSTVDNLQHAFAGESQANRKYVAFAKRAEDDGFPGVANLFRAIAAAETIHALAHLRALGGVKATLDNLKAAMAGEKEEFTEMYPPMVEAAKAERNRKAQISMQYAMEVEKVHYELYAQALAAVEAGKDLGELVIRVCPTCGHTIIGDAPDECPVCNASGEFYEIVA
ncbi:MAG: rubrerythrin family protein [Ancalomicrobiaceae bacterium]|nr:rubrerythrin family protein [Ancalomicrobiaceae bacterium]